MDEVSEEEAKLNQRTILEAASRIIGVESVRCQTIIARVLIRRYILLVLVNKWVKKSRKTQKTNKWVSDNDHASAYTVMYCACTSKYVVTEFM